MPRSAPPSAPVPPPARARARPPGRTRTPSPRPTSSSRRRRSSCLRVPASPLRSRIIFAPGSGIANHRRRAVRPESRSRFHSPRTTQGLGRPNVSVSHAHYGLPASMGGTGNVAVSVRTGGSYLPAPVERRRRPRATFRLAADAGCLGCGIGGLPWGRASERTKRLEARRGPPDVRGDRAPHAAVLEARADGRPQPRADRRPVAVRAADRRGAGARGEGPRPRTARRLPGGCGPTRPRT